MTIMVRMGEGIEIKKGTPQAVDQRKKDLCAMAGVRLIRLVSRREAQCEYFGFQPVTLSMNRGRGGVRVTAQWATRPDGQPHTRGALEFTADEYGMLEAHVPVSEKNMKNLAVTYLTQTPELSEWDIPDAKDRADVEAFANSPENQAKYGWENVPKRQNIQRSSYREQELKQLQDVSRFSQSSSGERPHLKATAERMAAPAQPTKEEILKAKQDRMAKARAAKKPKEAVEA